jgi:hypothetical protein
MVVVRHGAVRSRVIRAAWVVGLVVPVCRRVGLVYALDGFLPALSPLGRLLSSGRRHCQLVHNTGDEILPPGGESEESRVC